MDNDIDLKTYARKNRNSNDVQTIPKKSHYRYFVDNFDPL